MGLSKCREFGCITEESKKARQATVCGIVFGFVGVFDVVAAVVVAVVAVVVIAEVSVVIVSVVAVVVAMPNKIELRVLLTFWLHDWTESQTLTHVTIASHHINDGALSSLLLSLSSLSPLFSLSLSLSPAVMLMSGKNTAAGF